MGFGDTNGKTFEDTVEQMTKHENTSGLETGDTCNEDHDCEQEVFELYHERNSQIGTERHDDAPEVEVVCSHHGIIASR